MAKLLITGFEPFNGENINPSEMMAKEASICFSEVDSVILPVSFAGAFEKFQSHWSSFPEYDAVLMLGQAAGRKAVSVERVALNWMQNSSFDLDENRVETGRIIEGAPDAYIVDFFNDHWVNSLCEKGATNISLSAGSYVCNNLYFKVIHHITKMVIPTLFVHLPLIPEQAKDTEKPLMDFSVQKRIIFKLIQLMSCHSTDVGNNPK